MGVHINVPIGWAAWHPRHGFHMPRHYEGPIAFADLDGAVELVAELNILADDYDRTTNRNGWRAVKVAFVKVDA